MNIKEGSVFVLVFFVLAGIAIIFCIFWIVTTEKRLRRFFLGKKAKDLEETLVILEKDIQELKAAKVSAEKEIATINAKLKKSIRGLETLRYNPFPDQGSNQSFALGMLDENGDGVVLSSLYSRERMSIFAKPVKAGKSEYDLTSEEREVLQKAKV
jgi:hypothetical protein